MLYSHTDTVVFGWMGGQRIYYINQLKIRSTNARITCKEPTQARATAPLIVAAQEVAAGP